MPVYLNGTLIEKRYYPCGEISVRLDDPALASQGNTLRVDYKDSDDIIQMLLVADAVRRVAPDRALSLVLPYIPYGRQDRVCHPGEPFSLKVLADIINVQNFTAVYTVEPHSVASANYIHRLCSVSAATLITYEDGKGVRDLIREETPVLLSPDKGGRQRVLEVATALAQHNIVCAAAYADKRREDGQVTFTHVPEICAGRNILVIDDICDGGATFLKLADALQERGARDLYLYVTHGFFTKGTEELLKKYKKIFYYKDYQHIAILEQKNA
jgi:ribose-phosphate pyrophosphokinase